MKIAVGITGASGAIYAQQLLRALQKLHPASVSEVGVVLSNNAKTVWEWELGNSDYTKFNFQIWEKNNFMAPIASGSAGWDALVICPASMGIIGRIAAGISDDLVTRAADVMLKERKKLIVVPRETPYNLIQINNLKTISEAGGIVVPATPSFYSRPKTFEELADTVVHRVVDLLNLRQESYRWGEPS
jgi:4-hydroxy-3-polyprenylbenzoate decarboxylase